MQMPSAGDTEGKRDGDDEEFRDGFGREFAEIVPSSHLKITVACRIVNVRNSQSKQIAISDSADEKREEIIHRLLSLHNGTWSHLRLTTSSPFSGSPWPHRSPSIDLSDYRPKKKKKKKKQITNYCEASRRWRQQQILTGDTHSIKGAAATPRCALAGLLLPARQI
ncbi:hypothetical protein EYF80_016656 [Liparis tanakae]|uniref:Uncharacterized protein n=1 Tax=Liparis tanakae TaxID=230148 RepID=A0A4Z2I5S7_9TELE|nr:hypothetical protein EYF80_016656 [Liparis tanakae]